MRSKHSPSPLEPTPSSPRNPIKSEGSRGNEGEGLIRKRVEDDAHRRGGGESLLADGRHPLSGYMPFVVATKARIRWFLTSRPAIALSLHHRRLAASDPALEYDPATYSYRRKRRATPAPPETTGNEEG
jgi:hypothetical protein